MRRHSVVSQALTSHICLYHKTQKVCFQGARVLQMQKKMFAFGTPLQTPLRAFTTLSRLAILGKRAAAWEGGSTNPINSIPHHWHAASRSGYSRKHIDERTFSLLRSPADEQTTYTEMLDDFCMLYTDIHKKLNSSIRKHYCRLNGYHSSSSFYLKSGNKAHKHTQKTYRQTDRQYK